tara:strand:- start:800021 stop:801424 length:1404 start_codon:yes stop_codon:yes gene_type:complete
MAHRYGSKGVLLVALGICMPGLAVAQDEVDAGLTLVSDHEQLMARVEQLQQEVSSRELPGNSWNADVAEALITLGQALQEANDHQTALEHLERSVHINRINHGLFSLQQVPALTLQIISHEALGQWDDADGLRQYVFYVQSKSHINNNPELIPALVDYANWHLDAFADRRGTEPTTRLLDAYQLYAVALSTIEKQPNPEAYPKEEYLQQLAFISWLMHQTRTLSRMELLYHEERKVDDNWADLRTDKQYHGRNNAYLRGELALKQIIDIKAAHLAEADPGSAVHDELLKQYVESMLDLADWNLLFERRNGASRQYEAAWDALAGTNPELVSEVFDRVVLLPRFEPRVGPSQSQPQQATSSVAAATSSYASTSFAPTYNDMVEDRIARQDEFGYVTIEFDINRFGRATNISLLEADASDVDDEVSRRMVNALRYSKLRPRIRDGKAISVEGLVYRFPYEIESHEPAAQ